MDDEERQARRSSFGSVAEMYERSRPRYPRSAVEWALGAAPLRVLDLGAGTGKLSRTLLDCGHDVLAVEPDEAMRAGLGAALPGVTVLAGTAEQIPLPDSDVDAVVAGQAYHWFEPERAHPEIARVLRPGGTFAPMWNIRDDRAAWVSELAGILKSEDAWSGWRQEQTPRLGPLFGELAKAEFRHEQTLDLNELVGLVMSRSYVITLAREEQDRIAERVVELTRTHPDLAGRDRFVMPYVTVTYRAARAD